MADLTVTSSKPKDSRYPLFCISKNNTILPTRRARKSLRHTYTAVRLYPCAFTRLHGQTAPVATSFPFLPYLRDHCNGDVRVRDSCYLLTASARLICYDSNEMLRDQLRVHPDVRRTDTSSGCFRPLRPQSAIIT